MSLIAEGEQAAVSAATGFFGGFQGILIAAGIALAVGLAGGAYAGYRWELGTYETRVAADATAQSAAEAIAFKKGQDLAAANQKAGTDDAAAQQVIVDHYHTITKEVPVYVTPAQDAHACVTYGFVRVLYAAERGIDPATIPIASGQSDDACTDYDLSALATDLAADFQAANANAQQLTDLEAAVVTNDAIGVKGQ